MSEVNVGSEVGWVGGDGASWSCLTTKAFWLIRIASNDEWQQHCAELCS